MDRTNFSGAAVPSAEIARLAVNAGVTKAKSDGLTLFVLAVLAGAYISLGAMLFLVVCSGTEQFLGWGVSRLVGGLSFCLGLILVVCAGAELFTGNNLIAMAWASGKISFVDILRNWIVVYVGNVVGCLATVGLVVLADLSALGAGQVAETAKGIASTKAELPLLVVFARAVLCNALVCVAVWLTLGARSMTDKILAIIFPIAAFVALGLEHSIANWFFLPYGMILTGNEISWVGVAGNLVTSTLGNIVGGTLLVAGVYWLAYLRNERKSSA